MSESADEHKLSLTAMQCTYKYEYMNTFNAFISNGMTFNLIQSPIILTQFPHIM